MSGKFRISSFKGPVSRVQCSAFTLVELMTVIAIIAILAGLVLGISGYATRKADRSKAIADINKLQSAIEEYRLDQNRYPSNSPTWNLKTAVSDASFLASLSNSLPKSFDQTELHTIDPWGNPYWYLKERQFQYRLWSTGPDATDPADDITPETGRQ